MSPILYLVLACSSLLVVHLTAIGAKVFHDIAWHALEDYCRNRDRDRLERIHEDWDEVVLGADVLFILAIATFIISSLGGMLATGLFDYGRVTDLILGVSAISIVLLAAVVWIPKAISDLAAPSFIYHTWPLFDVVGKGLRPLSGGAWLAEVVLRRFFATTEKPDEEEALADEIRAIVAEGQYDGLLDSDVREMIEGVIELDDANVADIMTSRGDMDVMKAGLHWDQILDYVTEVGRTRIPVYEESQDEFVGVLYVKDLFAQLRKPEEDRLPLRAILRDTFRVPTSMRLDELLQRFLRTRSHLALAVDEYGAVAGLVTIEDVLEEIVGEIADESDEDEAGDIVVESPHRAIVLGRAHVEDINEQFGCELPEENEFNTIGGFLMHELGRVPVEGETIRWKDLDIYVLEASNRRAERLVLHRVDSDDMSDATNRQGEQSNLPQ